MDQETIAISGMSLEGRLAYRCGLFAGLDKRGAKRRVALRYQKGASNATH
jgi:hypothetical protein